MFAEERNDFRVCNVILNSVGQHNHFITQGNYKATCFDYRLAILKSILFQLFHKMLCTLWDPIVFTPMEYIKLNRLSLRAWCANCVYNSGIHKIGSFVS